jgi:hypothetical protein
VVAIDWVVPWDYVQGVDTFPKTVSIPSALVGHKLFFLAAGFAIADASSFTRLDAYPGHGNQDVGISELVAAGGETSVTFSLNGSGASCSGVIFSVGSGTSFVAFSNNDGGATVDVTTDFQITPTTDLTATGDSILLSVASVSSASAFSTANRLRQHGPYARILREGGNQSFSSEKLIFQCAIADVNATTSYPRSLAAGHWRATTDWLASGDCFITQALLTDTSGVPTVSVAPNAIVEENSLPGTDNGNYFLGIAGTSPNVSGYTDKCTYQAGDTVNFQVFTEDTGTGQVEIYRRGFYSRQSFGARSVLGNQDGYLTVTPTVQPAPTFDSTTGMNSCAWTTNASWTIPSDTPSGLYYVVYRRTDMTAAASGHFIVRPSSFADKFVYLISDATHQMYNLWSDPGDFGPRDIGGVYSTNSHDVYQAGTDLAFSQFTNRGYQVSFDRPYTTQSNNDTTYINDVCVGQICFFEAQGYDIVYASDMDCMTDEHVFDDAKAIIFGGHHEYVHEKMYNAYRNAQANGVDFADLSSNTALWRIGFDPADTSFRNPFCYKDTGTITTGAGFTGDGFTPAGVLDTDWTGTWRDSRSLNPDIRRENELFGQIFVASGPALQVAQIDQAFQNSPVWRNSSDILALGPSATYSSTTNMEGFELESRDGSLGEPTNIVDLWRHLYTGLHFLTNDDGSTYNDIGDLELGWTLHRVDSTEANGIPAPFVFNGGAWRCTWSLTLWQSGRPSGSVTDLNMQNAFLSIFNDIGMVPVTLQSMKPGEDPDVTDPSIGAPGPGRADVAKAYGLSVPDQTINAVGISSSESFENVTVASGSTSLTPRGVISDERFGTGTLTTSVTVPPVGIVSSGSVGNATCTSVVFVETQGIPSAAALGSQGTALSTSVTPPGLNFSGYPGAAEVVPIISSTSVSTGELVSSADSVFGVNTISPAGVKSSEEFGASQTTTQSFIQPSGSTSSEQTGSPTRSTTTGILPGGVGSVEGFGNASATGSNIISPGGLPDAARFGNGTVANLAEAQPVGITSQETVGASTVVAGSIGILTTGLAEPETVGMPTVVVGLATIDLAGVVSREQLGNTSLTTSITSSVNTIPTSAEVGTPNVSANVSISPTGGPSSGEAFGSASLDAAVAAVAGSVTSEQATGTPQVGSNIRFTVPSNVGPFESVGTPSVSIGAVTIIPAGIRSENRFGVSSATPSSVSVQLVGITSDAATGAVSVAVLGVLIQPVGIVSEEHTGNSRTIPGSLTIATNGIDSGEGFSVTDVELTRSTPVESVPSGEQLGNVTLGRVGSASSISSAEAFGIPAVHTGAAFIVPPGISSSIQVGSSRISLAISFVRVEADGAVVLFGADMGELFYNAVPVLLWEGEPE